MRGGMHVVCMARSGHGGLCMHAVRMACRTRSYLVKRDAENGPLVVLLYPAGWEADAGMHVGACMTVQGNRWDVACRLLRPTNGVRHARRLTSWCS